MEKSNTNILSKLLPYCGYQLKASYEGNIVDVLPSAYGIDKINVETLCTPNSQGVFNYKPILFSSSCLTSEIETEFGKEIPLLELANLSCGDKNWIIGKDNVAEGDGGRWFGFHKDSFFMESLPKGDVLKQWQLFQYLYSRHIAFNLDADQYLPVTDEYNPYK